MRRTSERLGRHLGVGLNMTETDWSCLFTNYEAELGTGGRALCVAGAMMCAFWDYHYVQWSRVGLSDRSRE